MNFDDDTSTPQQQPAADAPVVKTAKERRNERARARYAANPEKRREQERARYAANPEKYRELKRARYAANPEKRREQERARRAANPEKYREQERACRAANPEKRREQARARRAANPEKKREQERARYAANPEKYREKHRARRGMKTQFIYKLMVKQKGRCGICAVDVTEKHHVDHIVPLANGGKTELTNLQLLCPKCNLQKSARDPVDHMQSKGKLL